jgi:hypothetical protein
MKLEAIYNAVIVKPIEAEETTYGGIIVPDLGTEKNNPNPGLDQFARRAIQVEKTKNNDSSYYFDKSGFDEAAATWNWPLNHIDFETSTVDLFKFYTKWVLFTVENLRKNTM